MSINNLNTYLNVRDAHLRVVSGNVYAQAMNIGGINVETAHGLQSVSNTGNATSLTLEFANVTTGFVTTANAQIGRDLVVTGNATVSTDLTVSANATVTDTLTVSEHLLASKEATVTGNLHVTTIRSDSNVVAEYTGPHDRPLRKYPEVLLTADDNSSTSGYVASTSSGVVSGGDAYRAFDGNNSTHYHTPYPTVTYNSDGTYGNNSGSAKITDVDNVDHDGEWLKIQLPKAIKVEYMKFMARTSYQNRFPNKISILGSNDDSNWHLLLRDDNVPLLPVNPAFGTIHINATTKYKYYALVIRELSHSGATDTNGQVAQWELYGREEGDASLDTTLKTVYNAPATTGTQLEVYYDGQDYMSGSTITDKVANANATISSGSDITFDSTYKAWVFGGNASRTQTIKTGTLPTSLTGGTNAKPEISAALWFNPTVWGDDTLFMIANPAFDQTGNQMLEVRLNGAQEYRIQVWDGQHAGRYNAPGFVDSMEPPSNQWYHLAVSISGKTSPNTERKVYLNGIECTFNSQDATPSGVLNLPSNSQLELGRRPTAGSGATVHNAAKEFFGSIANFRLYSKALNAGQVQELYDYQKDYFLGSKSQVTLYKGHLGVGVTEPSGQLELAGDERIQEYPPRGMTGYETLVEGHGMFCAYASGEPVSGSYHSYQAFNKIQASPWPQNTWNTHNPSYSTSTGLPTRGTKLGSHSGEWLKLVLPYKIKVTSYQIQIYGTYYEYAPDSWVIVGSNDDIIWETIDSISGSGFTNSGTVVTKNYTVSSTKYYEYLALVCTKLDPQFSEMNISELRYYGTPGPTTLDKGSLTLGRSLDVPRISRYDVDTETPRPEKLVVDFDTAVNSSPTDISGKGNHGKLQITTYNAPNKSFDVAGGASALGSYKGGIEAITSTVGNGPLTVSFWVKYHDDVTTNGHLHMLFLWGQTSDSAFNHREMFWLGLQYTGGEYRFRLTASGGGPENYYLHPNTTKPEVGRWYHYTATQEGTLPGGFRFYIDGQELTSHANNTTNSGVINLAGSNSQSKLRLGYHEGSTVYFDGEFSQIKAYNVALEPSEVKKLYNLGRTVRSMVITDTAVGIGKVPEAQLDVRGNLNVAGVITSKNFMFHATGPTSVNEQKNTSNPVTTQTYTADFSRILLDYGSGYDTTNKRYTIPCSGYWEFDYNMLGRNRSGGWGWIMGRWVKNNSTVDYRSFLNFSGTASGLQEGPLVGKLIDYFNKGDTVGVNITFNTATTDVYMNNQYCHFYGKMLH